MDESEFHHIADNSLQQLAEIIESADSEDQLEIDLLEGILTILLEDEREFVINKHSASQQIWLSSPISGAGHYSYDAERNNWFDRNNISIKDQLATDLQTLAINL